MIYEIEEKILTDGSKVYDVVIYGSNGDRLVIGCSGEQAAHMFVGALSNAFEDYTVETLDPE